ncbi:hypothetical protein B0H16DRAFT_1510935 [Mycena metata]|uniref:Uncharacterized protein n=1 Tax=Mycena metata TaxID=1033252 RepID=A0AAD7JXQ6_9AGAR|nr:hypothetical protein B0H16DRAFT_1510935 [Mycena metata]
MFRYHGGIEEPENDSPHKVESMRTKGISAIKRMEIAFEHVDWHIGPDQIRRFEVFAADVQELKAVCKQLEHLLRASGSSARKRKMNDLLNIMHKFISKLESILGLDDFMTLYSSFRELFVTGQNTDETLHALQKMVENELCKGSDRVEEFHMISEVYTKSGRATLAAFMKDNVKAARNARGFREGVSSARESQRVYDALEKIDESLAKIGEHLKESQRFWGKIDRDLKSIPPTPTGGPTQNLPDGITSGPVEDRITVQGRTESPKLRKAGVSLVNDASKAVNDCTAVSTLQSSVATELQSHPCGSKRGRNTLSPLRNALGSIAKSNKGLLLDFEKYQRQVYLFFWFAGTSAEDKMPSILFDLSCGLSINNIFTVKTPEHQVALSVLFSKGLSLYAIPFEVAFTGVERQLCGIQTFWKDLKLTAARF